MIYIYAINLNENGVINPNLSLVQDIPAMHGMHLMNPNLKLGIESSGSFDFTIQPDDYFYDMFAQLKTIIRIDIDDENLFFGRVLTVENGFFGERKITCEGAISFLLDTYYPPVLEKNRTPITAYDYIMKVLNNHNAQCENDQTKIFNAGEIPGQYSASIHEDQKISNEEYTFGASSWTQTKSVLDDLKSHYGGCWRTRFVNNNLYLDWLDQYFTDQINAQKIEIGKNLITASESTEVDNIFTRVIAVGKNDNKDIYLTGYRPSTITGESWTFSGNYFDVSDLTKVYTDQELSTGYHDVSDYRDSKNRYGLIWKIVSFDEANNQEKLFKAATKWVKDNYHGTIEKIQVTAIDMNLIGENVSKIHIGDRVWLKFPYGKGTNPPIVERLLTCLEINYDLYNPENTSFSFGIPSMALTKNQRSSGKSTKQKASTPPPDTSTDVDEPKNDFDKWLESIKNWMKNHQVWYKHNIVDGKPKEGGPSSIIDSAGKAWKPYFWIFDSEMGDDGLSKVWIWHPRIGTVYNNGRNVTWVLDSKGRPIGNWVKTKGSDFTYSLINQLRLLDYIQYEYGINLQKDLSVKMPAVVADEDGNVDIFSNLLGGESGNETLLGKITSFIFDKTGLKSSVLSIFNSDGLNVAKILTDDGTIMFAQLDDDGNIIMDPSNPDEPLWVNIRDVHHSTTELKDALEAMGVTVDLLDSQVTIIGQTIGDETYGLVYDLAMMDRTVAVITDDVVLLGDRLDSSIADLTYDLSAMGVTVTNISTDVTNIGQKVDSSIADLTYNLAGMGTTVTNISSDVVNIGQKLDSSVSNLTYQISQMGVTVTNISSDVVNIGDKLDSSVSDLTYELVQQGYTVTNINSDVVNIKGRINAAEARIGNLEADYISVDRLESAISNIEQINVKSLFINDGMTIKSGCQHIDWSGTTSGDNLRISRSDVKNLIKNVSITSASDTLRFTRMDETTALTISKSDNTLTFTDSSGNTLSFSKAASATKVNGSWSGSTLTVTPSSTGLDSYNSVITTGFVTDTTVPSSPKYNITAYRQDNDAQQPTEIQSARIRYILGTLDSTPKIVRILNSSGTSSINGTATYTIPLTTDTFTTNGTKTPDSSYVGYSSVSVNIHPILSGNWSSNTLTVTANPSASSNFTSVVTTGFVTDTTTSPTTYKVVAYRQDDGAQQPTKISSADITYKLGVLSESPTIVRVLNSAGTSYINGTATYTIPLQSKNITAPSGTTTYTPDDGYVGLSSITVTASGGGDLSNVRTRFSATTGPSYYIEAYDRSTSNPIPNTTINYQLGQVRTIDSGDNTTVTSVKVQVQNTSGTQISNTPVSTISMQTVEVYPKYSTIYRPNLTAGYLGIGKITVRLSYSNWSLDLVEGTNYTYVASARLNDPDATTANSKISSGNLSAKGAYDNGWTGCYNSFEKTADDSKTLDYDEQVSVTIRQTRADGVPSTRLSRTYTAPSDRYSTGYNSGWDTARSKVNAPSSGSGQTFTIKGPNSARTGQENVRTYALANETNNDVVVNTSIGTSTNVVARITHGKYDAGWSGCYGTVGAYTATAALNVGSSTTVYAQAKASSGASSKTNVASVTVSSKGVHHAALEGNHTADYWNVFFYDSAGNNIGSCWNNGAGTKTGLYMPVKKSVKLISNGVYHISDFDSEGGVNAFVLTDDIEVAVPSGSTPSYSFSFVDAGRVSSEQSGTITKGYRIVKIPSTISISTTRGGQQAYRYLRFKLDGRKIVFLFD